MAKKAKCKPCTKAQKKAGTCTPCAKPLATLKKK